jgi:hypothetical protein
MPKKHIVEQGECLSLIAKRHGFNDWKKLYNHPDNAELKRKRPNPNVLFPGDEVAIPDLTKKSASLATGQIHKIVVKNPRKVLRLVLCNRDGSPLASQACTLKFPGGAVVQKSTDGSGKLEVDVPDGIKTATLEIGKRPFQLRLGHLNPLADTHDTGVSGAQGRLNNLGYGAGACDGVLGPRTKAALRLFQEDQKIDATGELDDATKKKLESAYGC